MILLGRPIGTWPIRDDCRDLKLNKGEFLSLLLAGDMVLISVSKDYFIAEQ